MRIISKYKDYYDSAQAFGAEPFVFNRDPQEEWLKESEFSEGIALSTMSIGDTGLELSPRVTFFCGKVYPSIEITSERNHNFNNDSFGIQSFFDFESLDKFISERIAGEKYLVNSYTRKITSFDRSSVFNYRMYFARDEFRHFFDRKDFGINPDELHHRHGSPIISYGFVSMFTNYYDGSEHKIRMAKPEELRADTGPHYTDVILKTVNPILSLYGFQKVISPYEANQEISMYVGGVLSNVENNMVQIDDLHMRDAKGFNDMSFKKEPTKKRK